MNDNFNDKNQEEIMDMLKNAAERVPVPDSLKPEQIEQKLKSAKQSQRRFSRNSLTALATAACLVIIFLAGFALRTAVTSGDDADTTVPRETAKPADNTTYAEVCELINSYNTESSKSIPALDSAPGSYMEEDVMTLDDDSAESTGASPRENSSPADYSETDMQVQNIMEGDIVKTDGTNIYTVKESTTGCTISIYKADGKNVTLASALTVSDMNCKEMYVEGSLLIVLASQWTDETYPYDDWIDEVPYDTADGKTFIKIYDISDAANPKMTAEHTQSGNFSTSRLSGGYLYTFSNLYVYGNEYKEDHPEEYIPQIDGTSIPEDKIRLVDKKGSDSYMVMTSIHLGEPDKYCDSLAALGASDTYYMNDSHIYVVRPPESWFDRGGITKIAKYKYDDGKFEYAAQAKIRGYIKDSYYMHEYKGNFCFVYTRYTNNSSTNGLCVMDENLKLLGELSDLGKDERIYSSYYIENIAYFVTFRETDPVFAVDISDSAQPKLKSELKLPGFSSYLHSFGDNMLIGIGKGDKKSDVGDMKLGGQMRVKLSLFSIGTDYKLTETSKTFLEQLTQTIADKNHKAVFVDEERGLIGFGVRTNLDNEYRVYRYQDGKFKRVLKERMESPYTNLRGLRIGNYFYVVDVSGTIKVYDINTWKAA